MYTKTEKAWVKLVEETIHELLQDMDDILKIANRMSLVFYICNWIVRCKLKKSYVYYDRMLWLPILHKNICDFKFVRRDPLKSVHRSQKKQMFSSQATTTNGDGISSLLNNFHNQLSQGQAMDKFTQLQSRLKDVHKLLMNAKAIEGIKHSRMAYTDQLKEIIKDAGKSLKSHGESSRSEWSENQIKIESRSKFKEIGRFKTTLRILEICITIF
nr:hypothetical protein CFP56_66099 [Quercus suber]